MDNILLDQINKLETQLLNLNPNFEMVVSLTAGTLGQIASLRFCERFEKLKLYRPFERNVLQNYYCIEYTHPTRMNITMIIKTREIIQKIN